MLTVAGLAVVTPDIVGFEVDVDDSSSGCFGGYGSVEDSDSEFAEVKMF